MKESELPRKTWGLAHPVAVVGLERGAGRVVPGSCWLFVTTASISCREAYRLGIAVGQRRLESWRSGLGV